VLSITGGTGAYRNSRGEMTLLSRDGGKEYDFIFKLSRGRKVTLRVPRGASSGASAGRLRGQSVTGQTATISGGRAG
jgi:hypothetical protein